MFYSHDILTNPKHGVATVWLIATLGSKSTLKKVGRKDILGVDVPKACEAVSESVVPLALRLQGNLLFGLTRVYERKCVYLLSDIETARTSLRDMIRRHDAGNTLQVGHVARREHITIEDDPNLILEDLFPADPFDSGIDFDPFVGSARPRSRSSSLLPSLDYSQNTLQSFEDEPAGLVIPSDVSSQSNYPLPQFGGSELSRRSETEHLPLDNLFHIDAEGNLTDVDIVQPSPSRYGEPAPRRDTTPQIHHLQGVEDDVMRDEDDLLPLQDDIDDVYAVPFARDTDDAAQGPEVLISSTEASSAHAPQKRTRRPKTIGRDEIMELPSNAIRDWEVNYLQNMTEAKETKEKRRAPHLARVNAEFLVFNNLLGMGRVFGKGAAPGPLQQFMGQGFFEGVTGIKPEGTPAKRTHNEASSDTEEADRRVRSRSSNDEAGRGEMDIDPLNDDQGFTDLDNTLEQARAGGTPLVARFSASTSIAPWNISASQRASSTRRLPLPIFSAGGASSSAGPGTSHGVHRSRRASSAISPSPLYGRDMFAGRNTSAARSRQDDAAAGLPPMDDYDLEAAPDQNENIESIEAGNTQQREFERFGLAAGVDTHTANDPGWLAQTLDNEAMNFLTFVHTSISDRNDAKMIAEQLGRPVDLQYEATMNFEELLRPTTNSKIVAAQGFLHILSLSMKGLLEVLQGREFGQVVLRVL